MDEALRRAGEFAVEEAKERNAVNSMMTQQSLQPRSRLRGLASGSVRRSRRPAAPARSVDGAAKDSEEMSQEDINRQTLEAVTRMVKECNISAEDAMRHAEALKSVKVRKAGDAQRILLMNMVKEGNISVEDAVKHAKGMGVDMEADTQKTHGLGLAEGKIYNFGIDLCT